MKLYFSARKHPSFFQAIYKNNNNASAKIHHRTGATTYLPKKKKLKLRHFYSSSIFFFSPFLSCRENEKYPGARSSTRVDDRQVLKKKSRGVSLPGVPLCVLGCVPNGIKTEICGRRRGRRGSRRIMCWNGNGDCDFSFFLERVRILKNSICRLS